MSFDQRRYENDVVKPLRTCPDDLPDDLVARYDVGATTSPEALQRRIREVRAYWRLKAGTTGGIGLVCRAFLRADEELVDRYGARFETTTWWQERRAGPPGPARPEPPARPAAADPPTLPEPTERDDPPGHAAPPAVPGPAPTDADPADADPADADPEPRTTERSAAPAGDGPGTALQVVVLAPDVATAGAADEQGATSSDGEVPPPTGLVVRRRGERALLAWRWPPGRTVAEVRWNGGEERLTRSRYRSAGGFALPTGTTGRVEVRIVVGSDDRRLESAPASAVVDAPRDRLRYVVRTEGSRRRGDAAWLVSLAPDHEYDVVRVLVVVAPGRTMPASVRPEQVQDPGHHVLIPGGQVRIPFPAVPPPFWIRCFSDQPDTVLLDPPPDDLKVT